MDHATDEKGRYEVTAEQLYKAVGSAKSEKLIQFDLRFPFDMLLTANAPLPRLANNIWRRVLDEAVAEHGGGYAAKHGTPFVELWLDDLPINGAKAKLRKISARMKDVYLKAHDKGVDVDLEQIMLTLNEPSEKKAHQISAAMEDMLHHGLMPNPSPEIFEAWLARTTQSLAMAKQKTPFAHELTQVVSHADLVYEPVWLCQNSMLAGSWVHVKSGLARASYTAVEPIRQDLLTVFAAGMQITMLAGKNINAMAFLTLHYSALMHAPTMDLLHAYLSILSPAVKGRILIELRDMPNGVCAQTAVDAMEKLAPHIKAFMLNTGIFAKDSHTQGIPKLYALGFNLSGMSLPEVELASLIRKYADARKSGNFKLYARGVQSKHLLKVAKESGYIYAVGSAIHAPEKFISAIKPYPIDLS